MTQLTLVPTKSVEQEVEEIQLSFFDSIVHEEDETWFQEALKHLEEEE